MGWYIAAMKKYADFSGRARRKEYWMFTLYQLLISMVLLILAALLVGVNKYIGVALFILLFLFCFASILPALACGGRRLHDLGKSAWYLLIYLIPLGGFLMVILMCLEGEQDANKYGENPKLMGA